jgi:hypothetical protein
VESSHVGTAGRDGGVDTSLALSRGGAWALAVSLGPFALACAFAVDYLRLDLSYRGQLSTGGRVAFELSVSHSRLVWIGMAIGATLLVSSAAWLVWQCSAHATISRMGIEGTRFKPGLALIGWLLPVGNLILPFLAMREIWGAREPDAGPRDWKGRRASLLLWPWWACFVAGASLAILGVRSELGTHVLNHQLVVRDRLMIAACLVGIVASGLAGLIVNRVNARLFVRANRAPHGLWSGTGRR